MRIDIPPLRNAGPATPIGAAAARHAAPSQANAPHGMGAAEPVSFVGDVDQELLAHDAALDSAKVERLKAALAERAYPVQPQAVADAMLAARDLLEICE